MRWLLWNDQYIKSSSNIFWSFGGFVWLLLLLQGSVHKWRHPHVGGRVSANRWCYSVSLFSNIGDKDEGGVKNLKKWVMSFMDGPLSKSFPLHNFYKTFSINFFSPLLFLLGPLLWIWRSIHSCSWARHFRIHSATYRLALWGADAWLCPRGFQVENVSDIFDVCLCVCSSIFMVTHLVQGLPHQTEQFLMKN